MLRAASLAVRETTAGITTDIEVHLYGARTGQSFGASR